MTAEFYPYLCGFRKKKHSAQYYLLKMMEICKKHLDEENKIEVILTDLSKKKLSKKEQMLKWTL